MWHSREQHQKWERKGKKGSPLHVCSDPFHRMSFLVSVLQTLLNFHIVLSVSETHWPLPPQNSHSTSAPVILVLCYFDLSIWSKKLWLPRSFPSFLAKFYSSFKLRHLLLQELFQGPPHLGPQPIHHPLCAPLGYLAPLYLGPCRSREMVFRCWAH